MKRTQEIVIDLDIDKKYIFIDLEHQRLQVRSAIAKLSRMHKMDKDLLRTMFECPHDGVYEPITEHEARCVKCNAIYRRSQYDSITKYLVFGQFV